MALCGEGSLSAWRDGDFTPCFQSLVFAAAPALLISLAFVCVQVFRRSSSRRAGQHGLEKPLLLPGGLQHGAVGRVASPEYGGDDYNGVAEGIPKEEDGEEGEQGAKRGFCGCRPSRAPNACSSLTGSVALIAGVLLALLRLTFAIGASGGESGPETHEWVAAGCALCGWVCASLWLRQLIHAHMRSSSSGRANHNRSNEQGVKALDCGLLAAFWAMAFIAGLAAARTQLLMDGSEDQGEQPDQGYRVYQEVALLALRTLVCLCGPLSLLTLGSEAEGLDEASLPAMSARARARYARTRGGESFAGFWARVAFSWLDGTVADGYKASLEHEDLDPLAADLTVQPCLRHFCECLPDPLHAAQIVRRAAEKARRDAAKAKQRGKGAQAEQADDASSLERQAAIKSLLYATFWRMTRTRFLWGNVCKALGDALSFAGPVCLSAIVAFAEDGSDPPLFGEWWGYAVGFLMVLSSVAKSVFLHQSYYLVMKEGMRVRAAAVSVVYRKSLKLTTHARQQLTEGKITNLMSTDCNRLEYVFWMGFYLWFSPLQVIVTVGLLIQYLGVSALAGVAVLVLLLPAQGKITTHLSALTKRIRGVVDARVGLTTEVLQGIRVIKYNAWSRSFVHAIGEERAKEVQLIWRMALTQAISLLTLAAAPILVSVAAFSVYAVASDEALTAQKAFTALSLFQMLRAPLWILPNVIRMIVDAKVAMQRLAELLAQDEVGAPVGEEGDGNEDNEEAAAAEMLAMLQRVAGGNDDDDDGGDDDNGRHGKQAKEAAYQAPSSSLPPVLPAPAHAKAASSSHLARGALSISHRAFWHHASAPAPALTVDSLTVQEGQLAVVAGSVGSGKSFLLSCLLGEVNHSHSHEAKEGSPRPRAYPAFFSPATRVAYVAQTAWIINSTLRENITFGLPFDEERYAETVRCCALGQDLAMLPAGDQTEIGERGINLSGGQKQRVSLARAVYRHPFTDVYLFDDPFSALDAHVAHTVMTECVLKLLKGKTRVLVTHYTKYAKQADLVVCMADPGEGRDGVGSVEEEEEEKRDVDAMVAEEGHEEVVDAADSDLTPPRLAIAEVGTYDSLLARRPKGAFARLCAHADSAALQDNMAAQGSPDGGVDSPPQLARQLSRQSSEGGEEREQGKQAASKAGELVQEEEHVRGSVSTRVYLDYVRANGVWAYGIVVALLIASSGIERGSDYWLTLWANDRFGRAALWYVGWFCALGMGALAVTLVTNLVAARSGLRAAVAVHDNMLKALLRAPVSFHDTTPLGRIVNRVSRDVDTVDYGLPAVFFGYVAQAVQMASLIVTISVVTVYFLAPMLPVFLAFYTLQQYYRRSSREIKRLDSISKSPVFAHFAETLDGLSTLRAYRVQRRFAHMNQAKLQHNMRAFWAANLLNRWLGVRVDFLGSMVLLLTVVFVVLTRDNTDSGLVGMSLTYALSLTGSLNWLVRRSIEAETNLNSVERALEYGDLVPEGFPESEKDHPAHASLLASGATARPDPPASWPHAGALSFEDVSVRYRADTPLVLKHINLKIEPGERVGVVGRTGAGKSSLMVLLFRMVECASGRVVLDGVDCSHVSLEALRSKLSIIPQDPVLFSGTVRFNMDPFGERSDDKVWAALACVRMKGAVEAMPGGLDADVLSGGENFSVGQRQLLCLARAVLRGSRVLVMDEATASVDMKTDALIQDMIRTEFGQCTVLTIAHRLETVIDYDKILVLEKGRIAEYGPPKKLLANPDGALSQLARSVNK